METETVMDLALERVEVGDVDRCSAGALSQAEVGVMEMVMEMDRRMVQIDSVELRNPETHQESDRL